jgi:antitoxin (DNA-binding transcriptional repressor) of toxin-antitoxin stability system
VEAGETVVIVQADKAIAELRPIWSNGKQLRPFGLCAGEFTVPVDFDAPLPEETLSVLKKLEGQSMARHNHPAGANWGETPTVWSR